MRWIIALVFLLQIPFAAIPATVQAVPVVTPLDPISQFGEQITFRVSVQPATDIKELVVYITTEGQNPTWKVFDLKTGSAQGEFTRVVKANELVLFPFAQVTYHFQVTTKEDQQVSSASRSFTYVDDRFKWQSLDSGIFQVHWNSSESTLGQEIANIATEGLQRDQTILSVNPPAKIRIYAYTSSRDLQTALQLTSQPWVAGHATPELAMVMISVPSGPEKTLELRRQIPHEIMHILQYQVMGKSFNQQPVWLVEGMASLAELSVNPEYRTVLKSTQPQQLIPFRSLCQMFPREAASAFQAYAQSESFVGFLQDKFGTPGLLKLIDEYKNGMGCEEGVSAGLGFSLNQLQYRWEQEELGINVGGLALSNLLPYLLLGLLILVPAALALIHPRRSKPEEAEEPL